MNVDRVLYGTMSINGDEASLGQVKFTKLLERIYAEYRGEPSVNGRCDIVIRISNKPIDENSSMSELMRLEAEGRKHEAESIAGFDPDEPSLIEGITMGQMLEIQGSPEYERLYYFANDPSKRIGADNDIREAKAAYESKFPGVFAKGFPFWVK